MAQKKGERVGPDRTQLCSGKRGMIKEKDKNPTINGDGELLAKRAR